MRFYLDGVFYRQENTTPWDFNNGSSGSCWFYDFGALSYGPHSIRATWTGGEDTASFKAGTAPPTAEPS